METCLLCTAPLFWRCGNHCKVFCHEVVLGDWRSSDPTTIRTLCLPRAQPLAHDDLFELGDDLSFGSQPLEFLTSKLPPVGLGFTCCHHPVLQQLAPAGQVFIPQLAHCDGACWSGNRLLIGLGTVASFLQKILFKVVVQYWFALSVTCPPKKILQENCCDIVLHGFSGKLLQAFR